MTLTISEIKELISFGQEIGLQQLQTEGLVVIYGQRAVVPAHPAAAPDSQDDAVNILAHYSAIGRDRMARK